MLNIGTIFKLKPDDELVKRAWRANAPGINHYITEIMAFLNWYPGGLIKAVEYLEDEGKKYWSDSPRPLDRPNPWKKYREFLPKIVNDSQ